MIKNIIIGILTICLSVVWLESTGQVNIKDSAVFMPIVDFSFAYKVPGGDLNNRFGNSSEMGLGFYLKSKKNFLYGIDWTYFFGNEVKETAFADAFRDANGSILGNNGLYSEIYFVERGYSLSAKFGKIFTVFSPNPNSGIMIMGGFGFLEHKIKMEDRFNEVPLLSADGYYQGYDRLSNGVMVSEFIGYRLVSNRRLINVFGGVEFVQGFTQNRRSINYDSGVSDNSARFDTMAGLKFGFTLLLYKPTPKDFYYN